MFRNNSVQSSHVHVSRNALQKRLHVFSQVGIAFSAKRKRAEPKTLEDITVRASARVLHSRINLPWICEYVSRVYHVFIIYTYTLNSTAISTVSTVLNTNKQHYSQEFNNSKKQQQLFC